MTVQSWDATTGAWKQMLKAQGDWIRATPDGRMLAPDDDIIQLWDATMGSWKQTLEGNDDRHDGIRAVAFSPGYKVLALSPNDKAVQLWDVTAGNSKVDT
jgi:WD40 repeat protein